MNDPLDRLAACHQHIEERLAKLERLTPRAAHEVMHYFDTAGALHHQDEDEDLFPLLRSRAATLGRSEIAAAIDELEREHATMDAQWRRLREKLAALAARRDAAFEAGEIERFTWLYRRHMDRESALVLPFAREVLGTQERAEFAVRMAARRGA